jgi:hypothetical protein
MPVPTTATYFLTRDTARQPYPFLGAPPRSLSSDASLPGKLALARGDNATCPRRPTSLANQRASALSW